MKERSGMPYDVVAYEADDLAMQLSEAEEGLFHRMLRRSWMNGSIPADLKELMHICRTNYNRLKKAWVKVGPLWKPHPGLPGRLINLKQESERDWVVTKQSAARAAAVEGWKQRKAHNNEDANAKRTQSGRNASPPLPLPIPVPSSTIHNSSLIDSPPADKRGGKRDPAADLFGAAYEKHVGNPYGWQGGDFPQLAKLRQRLKIGTTETPADWEASLLNYFASPLAEFSLQYFAAKFDTFKNSQLDRFHVPTNHKGNGNGLDKESRGERVARKNRETAAQFDHELFGADGDGDGAGSAERESTALLPRSK